MKKRTRLFIFLLTLAVIIAASIVLTTIFSVVKYEEIYTEVIVAPNGAFGIDKEDNLRFGKVPIGDFGKRTFSITSDQKLHVIIKMEGNISKFLSASASDFIIQPGENKTIDLYVTIPYGTPYATYNGYVQVYFTRPWFR